MSAEHYPAASASLSFSADTLRIRADKLDAQAEELMAERKRLRDRAEELQASARELRRELGIESQRPPAEGAQTGGEK